MSTIAVTKKRWATKDSMTAIHCPEKPLGEPDIGRDEPESTAHLHLKLQLRLSLSANAGDGLKLT
jgi:hypothetical protein